MFKGLHLVFTGCSAQKLLTGPCLGKASEHLCEEVGSGDVPQSPQSMEERGDSRGLHFDDDDNFHGFSEN